MPTEQTHKDGAAAIETTDLRKVFHDPEKGEVEAVRGVNLRCLFGEIHGLLGPNGAGKTTTLRMLTTILSPTSGSARVAGIDVVADPLEARRQIGFLSASTGLYPRLSVREILAYFGELHGLSKGHVKDRTEELVAAFDLSEFIDQRCEGLSSGQRQRASIARAVLHDPTVLVLDEPTTGLDILAASDMISFLEQRRRDDACLLFSTHVLSEAERLCDRLSVVDHGRILATGTLDELRARTDRTYLEDVFRALVTEAKEADADTSRPSTAGTQA
ncbi:MAG: sodium transport system ATP-binding protein [Planctomycetota bacterium]|jgi:sodium transport system ATP-binding protein